MALWLPVRGHKLRMASSPLIPFATSPYSYLCLIGAPGHLSTSTQGTTQDQIEYGAPDNQTHPAPSPNAEVVHKATRQLPSPTCALSTEGVEVLRRYKDFFTATFKKTPMRKA